MTPQTLSTAEDYAAAPLGTVGIDEKGWAWQKIEVRNQVGCDAESSWETTHQHPALSPRPETNSQMASRTLEVVYMPIVWPRQLVSITNKFTHELNKEKGQ